MWNSSATAGVVGVSLVSPSVAGWPVPAPSALRFVSTGLPSPPPPPQAASAATSGSRTSVFFNSCFIGFPFMDDCRRHG